MNDTRTFALRVKKNQGVKTAFEHRIVYNVMVQVGKGGEARETCFRHGLDRNRWLKLQQGMVAGYGQAQGRHLSVQAFQPQSPRGVGVREIPHVADARRRSETAPVVGADRRVRYGQILQCGADAP